jgi:hypothetical protein
MDSQHSASGEEEHDTTTTTTTTTNIDDKNTASSSKQNSSDRHVHWSPFNFQVVHDHVHHNDLTPKEKSDAWMTEAELEAILNDPWTQVFVLGQMAKRWAGGWFNNN